MIAWTKSLRDACAQAHVSIDAVVNALEHDSDPRHKESADPDFTNSPLVELTDHIINTHHAYVKQEIPRIHNLLSKVVSVHGKNHPELAQVQRTFQAMSGELISHLMKEENILFPYISALEDATRQGRPAPRPPFGTVSNPVHMMEMEHDSAGAALKEMRNFTADYTAPDDACFSYKTLYAALSDFEADLHQHVHLENNILFPRAIELESQTA